MNKNFKYNLIIIIISVVMIATTIIVHHATNERYEQNVSLNIFNNDLNEHPIDSFDGNSFVTDSYPIFKDVVIIGDSYSHRLSTNLGYDFMNYSCPGLTVKELENVFKVASSADKKYKVIFLGPNDFVKEVVPKEFYTTLKKYIALLNENGNSIIILTTYLHSKFSNFYEENNIVKYSIDDYNEEILKLINEDEKIYYYDLSDIEKDLDKYQDNPEDLLHYNYSFSVDFINKLYKLLVDIRKREIININD